MNAKNDSHHEDIDALMRVIREAATSPTDLVRPGRCAIQSLISRASDGSLSHYTKDWVSFRFSGTRTVLMASDGTIWNLVGPGEFP